MQGCMHQQHNVCAFHIFASCHVHARTYACMHACMHAYIVSLLANYLKHVKPAGIAILKLYVQVYSYIAIASYLREEFSFVQLAIAS